LRIIFMGTPEFSVPTLEALIKAGHEVAAVYTQPPRPAGRGKQDRPSPVHICAAGHGIEVRTPKTLRKPEVQQEFAALAADVAVVVAYGLILPKAILDATRHGCLNLHGSLLPRWRGAAPIQRAVMAGDPRSGVEVMRMEEGLDTGPVCLSAAVDIGPETTAGDLHDALMGVGARLMAEALAKLAAGALACTPQPEAGVTYADKIDKAEARIDWSLDAATVHNRIRGLSPFPGAFFEIEAGGRRERIKVLRSRLETVAGASAPAAPGEALDDALLIACGGGAVRLLELQREGKRPMPATELLRGFAIPAGTKLG
jgi:methionyl-tRNA formyltransferase